MAQHTEWRDNRLVRSISRHNYHFLRLQFKLRPVTLSESYCKLQVVIKHDNTQETKHSYYSNNLITYKIKSQSHVSAPKIRQRYCYAVILGTLIFLSSRENQQFHDVAPKYYINYIAALSQSHQLQNTYSTRNFFSCIW